MKALSAYQDTGSLTLNGEQALEELYARLARWCDDITNHQRRNEIAERDRIVERSITLLSLIDSLIDASACSEIADRILLLHRFAVRTLVKTKAENDESLLDGLAGLFISLGEIFSVMGTARTAPTLEVGM
ncbi:MAG TPA: flagellar protein FliS [Candidatus Binataceae bacterium]|nr:flagellar protein FliS [Candidatus Binataceae bacterium]